MAESLPTNALFISNDGPRISLTNYWMHEYARRGLFYLSQNAGAVRLLVPQVNEPMIAEMRTGKSIALTRGRYQGKADAVEILFDDGSNSPFQLTLDPGQVDRKWLPADEGHLIPFTVWTTTGCVMEATCILRRINGNLPYLKPVK